MNNWILRGGLVQADALQQAHYGDLLIINGRIDQIAAPGTPFSKDIPEFDASGYLLHPGLINAHTHGHGALTKGLTDRWNLEQLIAMGATVNKPRATEYLALSAKLNAAEMLLKGCTAAFDLFSEMPSPTAEGLLAIANAYSASGMRAVLAPMFADQSLYLAIPELVAALPSSLQKTYSQGGTRDMDPIFEALRPAFSTHIDRVHWALAPAIPLVSSDAFLLECSRFAQQYQIKLHTHALESPLQAKLYPKRYKDGLIQHLDRLGLLNNRLVLAHCVWLTAEERELLTKRKVQIAHNPTSNLRLGSGIADVREMLNHQITVGLGTDGATSSDNQNMYEAMRSAALLSRTIRAETEQWISASEAFYAATQGSAACLGFENELGMLKPGYLADIVFIDLNHINWMPTTDVIQQLVYVEDATAVQHVMVDGQWVVRDKQLTTLCLSTLKQHAKQAHDELQLQNALDQPEHKALLNAISHFCACNV